MAYPVVSGNAADPGTILFVGDYANKNTPLWLSMFGPKPGPGNVEVSSITVSGAGFVSLGAVPSTISTPATYAPIVFNRVANTPETASGIMMNTSHLVPGTTPDQEFITVTKDLGLMYDDLAVDGIQLFGNTSTDPTVNLGCAGRLYGTPAVAAQGDLEAVPSAVILSANSFNTNTINGQNLTVSQVGSISTVNAVNLNVSNTANISTLNTSTITTNTLNAINFISTTTAVAQNMNAGIANISTANISTANISTANISTANIVNTFVSTSQITTANISTANISTANIINASISTAQIKGANFSTITVSNTADVSGTITGGRYVLGNALTPSFSLNSQYNGIAGRGALFNAAQGTGAPSSGGFDFYTGGININQYSTHTMSMAPSGTVTVYRDLNASTINTNVVSTGTLVAPFISVSSILTNDLSFRPSLAPSVDMGLGGIVGGLVGGASANVFNTVLGAAALGTGIAGLTMPRTTGGLTSNTFQTYAGTAQIQFSTLGSINTFSQSTPTAFLTTTAGIGNFGSTISTVGTIPAGSWAFRTVSDPLNIATNPSTIGATSTIQAASQWTKVFPGQVSMGLNNNNIITQDGQNYIDMGGSAGSPFKIECNFPNPSGDLPASDVNIQINPRNQVVIGGGSSLNVGALTGVNTINGNVYPPPDLTIPIGSMLMWPVGSFALGARNVPPGYLVCDGSLLNISDYSVLAGLLGNTWSPFYPAGPADPTKFYLPNTTGRMAMGGVSTSYRVTAQYLNSYLFNVPGAPNRVGARFNNIQLANGAPGQLYVGMTASSPDTTTQISNIFLGGGGWNADVYVLFATGFVSTAIPGTIFTFDMTNPSGVPVIGLTNTIGGPACDGYGEPYRYQRETEVAVHTHQYNLGNGRTINQNNGDLIANNNQQTTGNPNNQFSIVGVGQVAEAYPQNPPNFGITYIIKAV